MLTLEALIGPIDGPAKSIGIRSISRLLLVRHCNKKEKKIL